MFSIKTICKWLSFNSIRDFSCRLQANKPSRSSEQLKLNENKKKLVKNSEDVLVEQLLGTSEPHTRSTAGQQDDSWGNIAEEDWSRDFDVIPKVKGRFVLATFP